MVSITYPKIRYEFLSVHPFLQFFPTFEKWEPLGFNFDFFTGFRIPSCIRAILFYMKGTQSTDLHPVTGCKSL